MSKSKQKSAEEISSELQAIEQEIADLEAAQVAEERSTKVEPITEAYSQTLSAHKPFEEAVLKLRHLWAEIEGIVSESETLRDDLLRAQKAGIEAREDSPASLQTLGVPESLAHRFPQGESHMRGAGVITGKGPQVKVCGRKFIFHRLRRKSVRGMTTQEQISLQL